MSLPRIGEKRMFVCHIGDEDGGPSRDHKRQNSNPLQNDHMLINSKDKAFINHRNVAIKPLKESTGMR